MIQDTNTLAEDKLSILYFMGCLGIPLTNGQITRFLENNIINYFELQQYIIELISGGLIDNMETGNSQFLTLTSKGNSVLTFFKKRISPTLRNIIESYAENNRDRLKDESQITADYKKINHKQYEVLCRVTEKDLVELKLMFPTVAKPRPFAKIGDLGPRSL